MSFEYSVCTYLHINDWANLRRLLFIDLLFNVKHLEKK